MIDWKKPIEFDNGAKAEVIEVFDNYATVRLTEGTVTSVHGWTHSAPLSAFEFNHDGTHRYGVQQRIRNVAPPLDLTAPIRTRSGLPARIVATNIAGPQPIAAAVMRDDGREELHGYTAEGFYYGDRTETYLDLVNYRPDPSAIRNVVVYGGNVLGLRPGVKFRPDDIAQVELTLLPDGEFSVRTLKRNPDFVDPRP